MAKKRTPSAKVEMSAVMLLAIQCLERPGLPLLRGHHEPDRLASFLKTDVNLISSPGRLQERQYVVDDLQYAANYFSHPDVSGLDFPFPAPDIARALRSIARNLT